MARLPEKRGFMSEYVPPPPEFIEAVRRLREKWVKNGDMSPEGFIARHRRVEKQLSTLKGSNLPEKPKDIYGVDPDKMSRDFEGLHSVVKDD